MTTFPNSRWWVILTAFLGVVPLGISVAMTVSDSGRGVVFRLVGLAMAAVIGALLIAGLVRRQSDLIKGSQMIVVGAALTLVGGFEFIPLGIIVLVSGFWTGNLQLSEAAPGPELHPVRARQNAMTRHWFVWLGVAALLFAAGWLPLIFDDPDNSGDLSFGGWYTWVLTWFGAMVTGGVGVILAGLRLTLRRGLAPTGPGCEPDSCVG